MSHSVPPLSSRPGPLSPSSSAEEAPKQNQSPPLSNSYHPHTPTSPPLMSVGAQKYASNFANTQTTAGHTTSTGQPLSSPPSSTPMSTQLSQQPNVSTASSFPTPASSVSGHLNSTLHDEPDAANKALGGSVAASATAPATTDPVDPSQSEHRRSDHDRLRLPEGTMDVNDRTTSADGDLMDIDQKADSPTSHGDPSSDSLQQDIGTAFHLCKTSPTISGPDPSLDLISLYGLGAIGRSVMRADPVTGEKINRLRKSYEGKLKGLGLAGRNKAVKNEGGPSSGLRHLTMWPEDEWRNQKVFGKEIKVADVDSALHKLQMRAMKMEPGPLPNNDHWEDVLGHEKPSKHVSTGDPGKKAVSTPNAPRQPGQMNGVATTAGDSERARPTRGKKRHYDENSFAGYGEGYADDDEEGAFYSNSDEGRSGKKKRKKEHLSKMSPPISERTGSYGVGVYGIGAR